MRYEITATFPLEDDGLFGFHVEPLWDDEEVLEELRFIFENTTDCLSRMVGPMVVPQGRFRCPKCKKESVMAKQVEEISATRVTSVWDEDDELIPYGEPVLEDVTVKNVRFESICCGRTIE